MEAVDRGGDLLVSSARSSDCKTDDARIDLISEVVSFSVAQNARSFELDDKKTDYVLILI